MSNRMSSVYHGKESGQEAPVIRIPYVVAGAIAGAVFFWLTSDYYGWGIGRALLTVLIGASLGLLAGLARSLLSRLMILGALFGPAYPTVQFAMESQIEAICFAPLIFLATAVIGAVAGACLAGLIARVREPARRS